MQTQKSVDLFVVGGGPAGLAVAMAARREGMSVMVADAAQPPLDKVCGEGLMPDGLDALQGLGFEIDGSAGYPFRGIRLLERGVSVDANFPRGRGLGMRRTILQQMMLEQTQAAGAHLRWGAAVDGISAAGVHIDGGTVGCRWIVGADGSRSRVRHWAGLDAFRRDDRRYGFRRHYRTAPWTDCMELYWGASCQVYVTPVAAEEICVAVISRNRQLRLHHALTAFPELAARLQGATASDPERGSITSMSALRRVWRGNVALAGDASGSVDAITGEGMCLAFHQAGVLARCLADGELEPYGLEHRRISRRPAFMADLMLTTGAHSGLRRRGLRAMASRPDLFQDMLAMHVGALSSMQFAMTAVGLAWGMLSV